MAEMKLDKGARVDPGALFDSAVSALKDESILVRGGLTAYVVYTVAVLVALLTVLALFSQIAAVLPTLILACVGLLCIGLAAGVLIEQLKFRKAEALLRYRVDDLRIRVDLATHRGAEAIGLLQAWATVDKTAFASMMGQNPNLIAGMAGRLDEIYRGLSLGDQPIGPLLQPGQSDSGSA